MPTSRARSTTSVCVMEALGEKDTQLAQLVDASNAVFAVFAKQEQNVQSLLRLLPGALAKTKNGLGKLATAADVLGPTLQKLQPFARALGPAQEATAKLSVKTTPIFKNQIRPFARQVEPVDQGDPARHPAARRSVPEAGQQLLGDQRILQRACLQPGPEAGRLPVLPGLGQPRPQQRRSASAEAQRRGRASSDLPQLQRRADPQRRR